MDPSMFKAAKDGDTEALIRLCQDDPLIVERTVTTSVDTPLHIAALLGHLGFIKELIKHKSDVVEYVKELNQHGFSAIHLASSKGHVKVVRELLKITDALCSLKGKDGMIPLHCACIKGRVETISHLLQASLDSISEVTVRSETSLHLAAKNNQLGALEVLVEGLKLNNLLHILNLKDEEGNTPLHLAAGRRNRQALELMLRCNISSPGVLQVNAVNESGLTALDLVQLCSSDSSYEDIERLLKQAGAERARFLNDFTLAPQNTQNQGPIRPESPALSRNDYYPSTPEQPSRGEILNWKKYFRFQFDKSNPDRVRTDLLLVAILMATATYLAGLNPPGGVWQNGPKQGEAVLASNSSSFIIFMFFNSAVFFIALNKIMVLTNRYPMFGELFVAIFAIEFSYGTGIIAISPQSGPIQVFAYVISSVLPISIPIISYLTRKCYKQGPRRPFASRRLEESV